MDEEILAAVQALQGGATPDAFEPIFRLYFRPLHIFFANRPSLRQEAEDLAQATLLRAYEKIDLFRQGPDSTFSGWLREIAENVWKNAVRDAQAGKRTAPWGAAEVRTEGGAKGALAAAIAAEPILARRVEPGPDTAVLEQEQTRVLEQAIEGLPPGMRCCAELRYLGELKYEEIAGILGIGLNSVRSQLFEARKRLKPVLEAYFQGADL